MLFGQVGGMYVTRSCLTLFYIKKGLLCTKLRCLGVNLCKRNLNIIFSLSGIN